MEYIKSKDTFLLMRDILKILYPKLMKHGSRVAYMVYTMLREEDKYEEFELADMVMAATLHDIGAYRTESERLGISCATRRRNTWHIPFTGILC